MIEYREKAAAAESVAADYLDGQMHIGRSFYNHPLEDDCPCVKAECGLVAEVVDGCEEHSTREARTIRQKHVAQACPALCSTPLGHDWETVWSPPMGSQALATMACRRCGETGYQT